MPCMVDLPCQMFKGWRGSDKKDLVELYRIPPKPYFVVFRALSRRKGEILCSFACNPVCSLIGTCRVFNLARSSCRAARTLCPFCVLGRINTNCECEHSFIRTVVTSSYSMENEIFVTNVMMKYRERQGWYDNKAPEKW